MTNVLIIDDDERLTTMLRSYLQGRGFRVSTALTLASGRLRLQADRPDIVVLDGMLPDGDGLSMLRDPLLAGNGHAAIPVIMLTARGEVTDRIIGLEMGADDYVAKPFEPRELVARMQAVLRRKSDPVMVDESEIRRSGRLVANGPMRQVMLGNNEIELSSGQFDLLWVLLEHPGRVFTREQLMSQTGQGEAEYENFDRAIDVQISRLRTALGDSARSPAIIKSVRGVGYVLVPQSE